MKQLTVRHVEPELAAALDRERRRSGSSLNQTVLDLLRRALGVSRESPTGNGLREFAGGWSAAEHDAFERACEDFERVDEGAWR